MNPRPAWILIPVKRFASAKTRLAACLAPTGREALSRAMLEDVLLAAAMTRGIDGVMVVGNEPALESIQRRHGFEWLREPRENGLNAALATAVDVLSARGVATCCILHADLPLARPENVERLLAAHAATGEAAVTLVPDRAEHGTNALACSLPATLAFTFGDSSFAAHREAARAAGMATGSCRDDSLALDIDTPADLQCLRHHYSQFGSCDQLATSTTAATLAALPDTPITRQTA